MTATMLFLTGCGNRINQADLIIPAAQDVGGYKLVVSLKNEDTGEEYGIVQTDTEEAKIALFPATYLITALLVFEDDTTQCSQTTRTFESGQYEVYMILNEENCTRLRANNRPVHELDRDEEITVIQDAQDTVEN